jgi:pyridinium-3,5-bisthiocarboxylic acid mononucleotide nickel chelatase
MKIAYFDCISGASGDMIIASLLDAGLAEDALRAGLAGLNIGNYEINIRRVVKNGINSTKFDVQVPHDLPERHLEDIRALISSSTITDPIREKAQAMFARLGEVEAEIHATSPDQVHLHELGGVDTLVDVFGTLIGLEALGIEKVYSSPLPLGRGFVQSAHGLLPLPAPATVSLLKGVPVYGAPIESELVTPTGALLLTSLASGFSSIPEMKLSSVGYGAGGRDFPIPNLLRVFIGEQEEDEHIIVDRLALLETNIDDLNPEIYDYLFSRLFTSGALDVFLSAIQMKKNRPGTMLHILCRPEDIPAMTAILFAETSTLGIRQNFVTRYALERSIRTVETPYGPVRVKVAYLGEGYRLASPEYEDCRRLAEENQVPLRTIYRIVERLADQLPPPAT